MIQIGNRKVTKIIAGGKAIWELRDPNTEWVSTVAGNGTTEFGGLLLMNYDPTTGMAIFRGMCFVQTKASLFPALFIELPNGYVFDMDKCPNTIVMHNAIGTTDLKSTTSNLTYAGSKCYAQAPVMSENYDGVAVTPWVPVDNFSQSMKFYIKKES